MFLKETVLLNIFTEEVFTHKPDFLSIVYWPGSLLRFIRPLCFPRLTWLQRLRPVRSELTEFVYVQ